MAEHKRTESLRLQVGQPFNPFKLFTGIFVPEGLVKLNTLSPGAKVTYGRLCRYAGQNGNCFPSVGTLASETGVGERQAQRYLAELERHRLIERINRFDEKGQTSNAFHFLWHPAFESGVTDTSPGGVTDTSPEGVTDPSPKESQSEESQFEEKNTDLDCPATNRKKRDSQPGVSMPSPQCRQYPRLREALADYMVTEPDDERVYPKDRHIVDIMDAAAGATEEEVLRCLTFLREERGLKAGTKNGPHHFSWFLTVVGDYFRQRQEREEAANPIGYDGWEERNATRLSEAEFDSMTDAF